MESNAPAFGPASAAASGYQEIPHTADWALRVWAADLPTLFAQAAQGMYALMETSLQASPRVTRRIDLEAPDVESLLVAFLSELLYAGEADGLAFDRLEVTCDPPRLAALLQGAPIAEQRKEIKAVTYHHLAVQATPTGWEVTIVFDV